MNAQRLFRRLKRKVNSYGATLPITGGLDQYMIDIIEDTTLPVFSIVHPRYEEFIISTTELQRDYTNANASCDCYTLPARLFEGREVLFVRDVEYAAGAEEYHRRAPGMEALQTDSGIGYLERLMVANAAKPFIDDMVNRVTFKYKHPRLLYIFDALLSSRLQITLACEHDTSLQSIEPTAAESFYQLAELDVLSALWDTIKPYEGSGGAYDQPELKIDDWKEASGKREQLLEKWDESYMLDQGNYDFG